MGSERMHTLTNRAAEGLGVLDTAPSREQIEERISKVAAGKHRRPVLVLGIVAPLPQLVLRVPEGVALDKDAHIPADLVVTSRSSHNPIDLSTCYPHYVSSARTLAQTEMRHATGRQTQTPKSHHHRRFP
jgi:hypothetical protein